MSRWILFPFFFQIVEGKSVIISCYDFVYTGECFDILTFVIMILIFENFISVYQDGAYHLFRILKGKLLMTSIFLFQFSNIYTGKCSHMLSLFLYTFFILFNTCKDYDTVRCIAIFFINIINKMRVR